VLVTGGSAGIGAATAEALAGAGAKVAVIARSQERLDEVRKATGALTLAADVADPVAVADAVEAAAGAIDGLDAVVNNAGLMVHSPPSAGAFVDWEQMVRVNVLGLLHVTHAALPRLRSAGQADVVNIGSVAAARTTVADFALYSATKAAVARLTEGLRLDLDRFGIRVALLSPGVVNTPGFGPGIKDAALRERAVQNKERNGLDPRFVAQQVCYLLALPREVCVEELVVQPNGAARPERSEDGSRD
jgi:NADP-dependent 3-hydroxy acid dehydrogenase YdfG